MTGRRAVLDWRDPEWQDDAACRGKANLFFAPINPATGRVSETDQHREARLLIARSYCAVCPVKAECDAAATARREWDHGGVWAGRGGEPRDPDKPIPGRIDTLICGECDEPFQHLAQGGRRIYCDDCRANIAKEKRARNQRLAKQRARKLRLVAS